MCERGKQVSASSVVNLGVEFWSTKEMSFSWCHLDRPKVLQSACVKAEIQHTHNVWLLPDAPVININY